METPENFLDSSLINSLGWKSKTSLDEGLEITVEWFNRNFKLARK